MPIVPKKENAPKQNTMKPEVDETNLNPRWYMKFRPVGYNKLVLGDKWILMGRAAWRLSDWAGGTVKGAFLHDILFAPDGVRLILTK